MVPNYHYHHNNRATEASGIYCYRKKCLSVICSVRSSKTSNKKTLNQTKGCLGVTNRSSDAKPIGRRRLDRSGNTALKNMSYRSWLGAMNCRQPNEVQHYFDSSLSRTHNRTHARLNTQRKILTCLWTIWKNNTPYSATGFLGSSST